MNLLVSFLEYTSRLIPCFLGPSSQAAQAGRGQEKSHARRCERGKLFLEYALLILKLIITLCRNARKSPSNPGVKRSSGSAFRQRLRRSKESLRMRRLRSRGLRSSWISWTKRRLRSKARRNSSSLCGWLRPLVISGPMGLGILYKLVCVEVTS